MEENKINFSGENNEKKHLYIGATLVKPSKDDENYSTIRWFSSIVSVAMNAVIRSMDDTVLMINDSIDASEVKVMDLLKDICKNINDKITKIAKVFANELTFAIGGENVDACLLVVPAKCECEDFVGKEFDGIKFYLVIGKLIKSKDEEARRPNTIYLGEIKFDLKTKSFISANPEYFDMYTGNAYCDPGSIDSCIFRNITPFTAEIVALDRMNLLEFMKYCKLIKNERNQDVDPMILRIWNSLCKILYAYRKQTECPTIIDLFSSNFSNVVYDKYENAQQAMCEISKIVNIKIVNPADEENNAKFNELMYLL